MNAVIVAGGKGTRMGGLTAAEPKPMLKVGGVPVIGRQAAAIARSGVRRLFVMTGYLGAAIEDYLGDGSRFGLSITHIREDEPLGTAGCIKKLRGLVDGEFLLVYGDLVFELDLEALAAFHADRGGAATLVVHPNDHPHDSDVVAADDDGLVTGFLLKRAKPEYYPNLASAAIYVLTPRVFDYIPASGPSDFMADVFPEMLRAGERLYGYRTAEYVKDMGSPDRFRRVEEDVLAGRPERRSRRARRAAVFMDRDGTLVEDVEFLSSASGLVAYPFAARAVKRLNDADLLAIVATNQPVVARNDCDVAEVRRMHDRLETELGRSGAYLDAIYFCPHHPDSGYPGENPAYKIRCSCRKPETGMVVAASRDLNVDVRGSWFIGDSTADVMTARNAGLCPVLVRTGKGGKDGKYRCEPDYVFDDVAEAVDFIVEDRLKYRPYIDKILDVAAGNSPALIAVGGQARSGKSVFSGLLASALAARGTPALLIRLDDWLLGRSERADSMTVRERYDYAGAERAVERLLDGGEVSLTGYEPRSMERRAEKTLSGRGFTRFIVDGAAALDMPGIRGLAAARVFVRTDEETRRERFASFYRWKGLDEPAIESLYAKRLRDEVPFIEESARYADITVRI